MKLIDHPSLFGDAVLAKCPDFLNERSALEELLEKRGHICLNGVCCHPEFAGCGVEYVFGMSKKYFRKHNSDNHEAKYLKPKVLASFSDNAIEYKHICKFERRTRAYMMMYMDMYESEKNGEASDLSSYASLEKTMKERKKTHRNILEIESGFSDF